MGRFLDDFRMILLRSACPPTHLHAPYLYVPYTLALSFASAMRLITPWVGPPPRLYVPKGPLRGPWAQGCAFGVLMGAVGMISKLFRWRFAPSHPCIAEVRQPLKPLKKDVGQAKAEPANHPENVVFVIEKASFSPCFGHGI